nr:hypothetical protein Iba_chr01aCG8570 [Ipomoea batatas]
MPPLRDELEAEVVEVNGSTVTVNEDDGGASDFSNFAIMEMKLEFFEFHGDATVAALIDPSTQDWDVDLLHEMFIDS